MHDEKRGSYDNEFLHMLIIYLAACVPPSLALLVIRGFDAWPGMIMMFSLNANEPLASGVRRLC